MLGTTYVLFTPELSWKCIVEPHTGVTPICENYSVSHKLTVLIDSNLTENNSREIDITEINRNRYNGKNDITMIKVNIKKGL